MNSNILDTTKKVYELLAADQACTGQAKEVKLLADKLENRSLTVSVIGQFKRGKSTDVYKRQVYGMGYMWIGGGIR